MRTHLTWSNTLHRDAQQLRDALRGVLVAHHVFNEAHRPCGEALSLPHAHALLTLSQAAGSMSIAMLGSSLRLDRSNVSRLCARMERAGQVDRVPNPKDGRSVLIRLTTLGQERAAAIDRSSTQHFASITEALGVHTPSVVDALLRLAAALHGEPP